MFTFALALGGGILLGNLLWRPPIWLGIFASVCLVSTAILCSKHPRFAWLVAHGAVIALGWIAFVGHASQSAATAADSAINDFLSGQEVTFIGTVQREPGAFASATRNFLQLDLATESLTDATHSRTTHAGIRLNIYSREREDEEAETATASHPRFKYGDRIRVIAKLRPPKNFRNPGALDYESYLRRQGITALGSAKLESIELLGNNSDRIGRWRSYARHSIIARIHQLWPERQAALMDAMLIGERAFIEHDVTADFQRSGTYHVLVVSGMNVGILSLLVFWLLRRLRFGEVIASAATVILAAGYAFLCDGGAPIVRAALMLAIFLIARLMYRDRSPLNALGIAAALVLLFDPAALFDTSFQLTFLCVLVIAGLAVPLFERTSDPWRRGLRHFQSTMFDLSLPPRVVQFRLDLRLLLSRVERFAPEPLMRFLTLRTIGVVLTIWEVFVVSALMQVALVLPMARYFHRATLTALPANILIIPLTGILMPASAAALALSYVSQSLAALPAFIAGLSLHLITGTVHIAGSLRYADLRLPSPSWTASLLSISALAVALLAARRSRRWAVVSLAALIAAAVFLVTRPAAPQISPGQLEVSAIDVGQADSTLLVSPEGRAMLVDAAGPLGFSRSEFDYGENVVSPYLWARGFSRLDVVVISHGHSDHIGGMLSVLNSFRPRELWVSRLPQTPAAERVLTRAQDLGISIRELHAGDELNWSGTHIRVLAPATSDEPGTKPHNNDSLAFRIAYQETAVLLEGDSEKQAERLIALQKPEAVLLKVAHNGSLTSTTPELLDAVQPRYAFISVGARNPFRHPRPEILGRLAQRGIATYRTDTMGALTFLLDGKTVTPPTPR